MRAQLRAIAALSDDPAHDIGHFDRVWRNAQIISKDLKADQTVLLAASYLHDLVNLPKDDPNRHRASTRSAAAARPHLIDLALTSAQIQNTQHAIIAHSFSANVPPETLEAKIIQDADRIDALGAVGLARCFAVSGALGRPLWDPDDPFATRRPLDDSRGTLDHFQTKLLTLPDTMQTDAGRALAQTRTKILTRYIDDLAQELPSSG